MYELSVAFKYLIPRWRQLSVSIISLISICVIALVVWLIVVFFSVTSGLEKTWVHKLIAFTAPIRLSPSETYYHSYYYLIDGISSHSNYTEKSIGEKHAAPLTNPYNPEIDQEVPWNWPKPDSDENGSLKDPVKLAFASIGKIQGIPGLKAKEYQTAPAQIKLILNRGQEAPQLHISQAVFLSSYDSDNPNLVKTMLPLRTEDSHNLLHLSGDSPEKSDPAGLFGLIRRLREFYENLESKHIISDMIPGDPHIGEGVILPKGYRDSGVLIGDRGSISYQTATAASIQEQLLPVYAAGFYDPGILPLGGKILLANPYVTSMIRSAYINDRSPLSNGIHVRFDRLEDTERAKEEIQKAFADAGIAPYWTIETFREFEFTKNFLQQLRSEKNLFSLISSIILIVACANIVSMLVILVNNKKMEIGILRSMGAPSRSIAFIFGICGMTLGLIGSLIGIAAAIITLRHLQALINLISRLQGFDAFNPVFYGETLPNELSIEALAFVAGATMLISLIAGVIPAMKASFMQPSAILRSE